MWVVYNTETIEVYGRFYSKASAKKNIAINRFYYSKRPGLEKVDLMKLNKWKMWKMLMSKEIQQCKS